MAVEGILHRPVITKTRSTPAASAGPPYGPSGSRVSTMRHGVTVKNDVAHKMGTLFEPIELHPPACTVTSSATVPELPAVNVIVRVPAPAVIVPPPIVHEYVAPIPASGTEAMFPVELGHTEDAAVIEADGAVLTTAFVVPAVDVQPATVPVTL